MWNFNKISRIYEHSILGNSQSWEKPKENKISSSNKITKIK